MYTPKGTHDRVVPSESLSKLPSINVGSRESCGVIGLMVGRDVGSTVGSNRVGRGVIGLLEGAGVVPSVGLAVGCNVVGATEGIKVGRRVASRIEGAGVAPSVGLTVVCDMVGSAEGSTVGLLVGSIEG